MMAFAETARAVIEHAIPTSFLSGYWDDGYWDELVATIATALAEQVAADICALCDDCSLARHRGAPPAEYDAAAVEWQHGQSALRRCKATDLWWCYSPNDRAAVVAIIAGRKEEKL